VALGLGAAAAGIGSMGLHVLAGTPWPLVAAAAGLALTAAGAASLQATVRRQGSLAERGAGLLERAQEDLEHIFTILPAGTLTIDGQGGVRLCNQKALDLLGCTEDYLRAVNWSRPAVPILKADGNTMEPGELPMNMARATGRRVTGMVMGVERPGDGDWVRRRFGVFAIFRRKHPATRFCFRAARQSGNAAPLPGSD